MNKIQAFWDKKIEQAELQAAALNKLTGFTYRVRHLFNGVNIEAYSTITGRWYVVNVLK